MSVTIDLSGKTVLITGASQGIGAQIARTFQRAGCRVLVNYLGIGETASDAAKLCDELNALRPQSALALSADISDAAQVQAMMCAVEKAAASIS